MVVSCLKETCSTETSEDFQRTARRYIAEYVRNLISSKFLPKQLGMYTYNSAMLRPHACESWSLTRTAQKTRVVQCGLQTVQGTASEDATMNAVAWLSHTNTVATQASNSTLRYLVLFILRDEDPSLGNDHEISKYWIQQQSSGVFCAVCAEML
jgi:hypothetical protein